MNGKRKKTKEQNDRFIRDTVKNLVRDLDLRTFDIALLGPRQLRHKLKAEMTSKSKVNIIVDEAMPATLEEMVQLISTSSRSQAHKKTQTYVKKIKQEGKQSLISHSLEEIGQAAIHGRIERLAIDPRVQIWGLYDRASGLVKTHKKQMSDIDDCVLDDITEEVLSKGGEVLLFDSSTLDSVAPYLAILRW